MFFASYMALLVHVHVLVLVLFCVNCCCNVNNDENQQQLHHKNNPYSSSCGDIHNITFPFLLKSDPHDNRGIKYLELECENNQTVLYLLSRKYYVQAINYSSHHISLVDVGIQRNNCSTLPLHSLTPDNFTNTLDYNIKDSIVVRRRGGGEHSYVLVGDYLSWSDVENLCSVDMIFPARMISGRNISSFLDVHSVLADGFDLVYYQFMSCNFFCRIIVRLEYFLDGCRGNQQGQAPQIASFRPCPQGYEYDRSTTKKMELLDLQSLVQTTGGILSPRIPLALCLLAFLIHKFRRRHLSMFDCIGDYLRSQNHLMPISYSYSEIKKMTKGFKDKLGEGVYDSVYKGKLRSGNLVAIKVLGKPKANGQEFINEVAIIGRIYHVNVVQLIGYCVERSKQALIYDFMPNGSLEKYTFSQEGDISLSCKQMYEISLGVARGIEYLHRDCNMQILHFNIKPDNILLDENFTPKVSDFGLAKSYATDDSIVTLTAARGTMGYMAPKLFYKNIGGISYKAVVYNFRMLLMEMASRRRNLNAFAEHTSQIYFSSWIYDQFKGGMDIQMGETNEEERVMVKKMVIVALWCIQMQPSDHPSMNKVVDMLEGDVEQLQMPSKPFMCLQERPIEEHRFETNPTKLSMLSSECINSVTLDVSEP
ncbi:unnamed protein product [Camellia sinensis]